MFEEFISTTLRGSAMSRFRKPSSRTTVSQSVSITLRMAADVAISGL